MFETEFKV
ncbi:hypothetical protein YPPY54_2012, partial [Yersinia pestis PY-54]